MSTVLKLSGVKTYMSGLLFHINLNRGDVIRVSDDVAGKIGGLHRMSENDPIKIYFFETVPDSTPLTYDFTSPTVLAEAANRAGDSDYMKRTAATAATAKEPEPQPVVEEAPSPTPLPAPPKAEESAPKEDPAPQEDPQEPEAPAAAAPVVPARKRASQRAAK